MAFRIKNTAPGPRGIHTLDSGLVFIPPGESRTIDPVDMDAVRRRDFFEVTELDEAVPPVPKDLASKFDADGDGKPGGSKKGAASTAAKGAARRRAKVPAKAKATTPKKKRATKAKP